MKALFLIVASTLVTLGGLTAVAEDVGALKIRFEYGGNPFDPKAINADKDAQFCGQHNLKNENLIVNKDNKGIANVVVYVYTGRGGSKLAESKPSSNVHTLANKNCRFEPHVVISQTGDTLKVTNPDPVGHNANISFFKNVAVNLTIPPGQEKDIALPLAEPAPIPVACNIHPWMQAHLLVLDHPFAAKSDENGELTIEGLPAGDKLTFRVWVEAGSVSDVTVDGKKQAWKSQRFEVDIKPGMNDMGTVVVPAIAGF